MNGLNRRTVLLGGIAAFASGQAAMAQAKPKIVVTGDLGTVGRRATPLLAAEYEVIGVDKKRGPLEDLAIPGPWMDGLRGAKAVLHLAWDTSNYNSVGGAMYNVGITQSVLSTAWHSGVPSFIFASSAWAAPELYGGRPGKPGRVIPAIYSESKRFLEGWMDATCRSTAMDISCIRFGQVNIKSQDQSIDPDFDERVLMTDTDLTGLIKMALAAKRYSVIGPFDAR